jgi:hypothetical protein
LALKDTPPDKKEEISLFFQREYPKGEGLKYEYTTIITN